MIALRGQSTWRVFIIHVLFKAFADAYKKRGDWEHATLLFCAGVLALEVRGKKKTGMNQEHIIDAELLKRALGTSMRNPELQRIFKESPQAAKPVLKLKFAAMVFPDQISDETFGANMEELAKTLGIDDLRYLIDNEADAEMKACFENLLHESGGAGSDKLETSEGGRAKCKRVLKPVSANEFAYKSVKATLTRNEAQTGKHRVWSRFKGWLELKVRELGTAPWSVQFDVACIVLGFVVTWVSEIVAPQYGLLSQLFLLLPFSIAGSLLCFAMMMSRMGRKWLLAFGVVMNAGLVLLLLIGETISPLIMLGSVIQNVYIDIFIGLLFIKESRIWYAAQHELNLELPMRDVVKITRCGLWQGIKSHWKIAIALFILLVVQPVLSRNATRMVAAPKHQSQKSFSATRALDLIKDGNGIIVGMLGHSLGESRWAMNESGGTWRMGTYGPCYLCKLPNEISGFDYVELEYDKDNFLRSITLKTLFSSRMNHEAMELAEQRMRRQLEIDYGLNFQVGFNAKIYGDGTVFDTYHMTLAEGPDGRPLRQIDLCVVPQNAGGYLLYFSLFANTR